jgi:predicted Zn-dependent protease
MANTLLQHRARAWPVLGLLAVLFGAVPVAASDSAALPSLGRAGGGAIALSDEYQLGLQIMREIRRQGTLFDDPLLRDYLQSIGHRIASNSENPELPFYFFPVRDDSINAFALPGGFIGVNTGLVLLADDEAELAGVMAHEVAHVTQRHVARRVEAASGMNLKSLAAMLGAIAIAASSGASPETAQAALMSAQAYSAQQSINFTRANEYEADRVGIQILADAGFDPEGMIGFFEKMQRDSAWAEGRRMEFLSTHPLSSSRINEARQRARRLEVAEAPKGRLFPLMSARTRVLTATEPRDAVDWFQKRKPDDATRYGLAIALTAAGRAAEAVPIAEALVAKDASVAPYHLALAEAQAAADLPDGADATFARAVHLFPTSSALALAHAEWLLARGEPARAHETIIELLQTVPDEPVHYRLLARAAEAAGSPADARYYQGEQYLLTGDLFGAMDQLRQALAVPGSSDFQRARYQARLDRLLGIAATLSQQQRDRIARDR